MFEVWIKAPRSKTWTLYEKYKSLEIALKNKKGLANNGYGTKLKILGVEVEE